MNTNRGFYVVAALLAASGVALRLTPIQHPPRASGHSDAERPNDHPVAVTAQATSGEATGGHDDPIISANIFSRARVAPPRRSVVAADPASRRPVTPREPTFTLYGTTIGPQGAVALITTGAAKDDAQLHAMGDVIAGARLVAITESTVTLMRPTGPLVLHVAPASRQAP